MTIKVRLKTNTKVDGSRTKTTSWKIPKCSVELGQTADVGDNSLSLQSNHLSHKCNLTCCWSRCECFYAFYANFLSILLLAILWTPSGKSRDHHFMEFTPGHGGQQVKSALRKNPSRNTFVTNVLINGANSWGHHELDLPTTLWFIYVAFTKL